MDSPPAVDETLACFSSGAPLRDRTFSADWIGSHAARSRLAARFDRFGPTIDGNLLRAGCGPRLLWLRTRTAIAPRSQPRGCPPVRRRAFGWQGRHPRLLLHGARAMDTGCAGTGPRRLRPRHLPEPLGSPDRPPWPDPPRQSLSMIYVPQSGRAAQPKAEFARLRASRLGCDGDQGCGARSGATCRIEPVSGSAARRRAASSLSPKGSIGYSPVKHEVQ